MSNSPYVSLILPAYNEAQRIAATIGEAKAYFESRGFTYEIIVSADGNDGTREKVQELAQHDPRLKVIGSADRGGKGRGVRLAVPLTSGEIVGYSDADNKTPIEEFDKFEPLLRTHDIVIGSRGLSQSRIERRQPLYRQLGSKGFGIFMHMIVGLPDIVDTQCGFKFFRRPVAVDIFSRQTIDGYMFDVEILHLAQKSGYKIAQVPIRWRDDGDSRLQLLSGNLRNVRDIFRIRFASPRSRAVIDATVSPDKSQ